MRINGKLFTVAATISLMVTANAFAAEITCGSIGGMNRCPLPGADRLNVKVIQVLEGNCAREKGWWADSDGVVVDQGCNAVFSYTPASATYDGTDTMASAYYDNGCKAGASDKKSRLSMAYERHSGSYDTANAGSYEAGYNKCWMRTQR